MNIKTFITGVIFLLIGLGVLVGDFFMVSGNLSFLNNSLKADGNVVRIVQSRSSDNGNFMYSPEISFTDALGQTITFDSNISSSVSTYQVGEKVSVLYNKNNPQDAKINTFFQLWFGPILMTFLGAIFFIVGLLTLVFQAKKASLKKEMLSKGTKISAKVISVETSNMRSGFSYGSRIPAQTYQIVAQWLNPNDNKMYIFKSDNLSYNPESIVTGKNIDVYIDPLNLKKYYVDISALPASGN